MFTLNTKQSCLSIDESNAMIDLLKDPFIHLYLVILYIFFAMFSCLLLRLALDGLQFHPIVYTL